MKFAISALALAAAFALPLSLGAGTAAAAGKCVKAGGQADMVTEDLARFMANAALQNSIKGMGAKPVGPVSMKCGPGVPVNCKATQKACK